MRLEPISARSGALVGVVAAVVLVTSCNPAIARSRGVVTSVREDDEQSIEVCIRDTEDAGSTYGDKRNRDHDCWSGVLEGSQPEVGECVVLQAQGESSTLRVETADDCK